MYYIQDFGTPEEIEKDPTGGLGYLTYTFDLNRSMESITDGLVDIYRSEHERGNNYFYIEYAGIQYNGNQQGHKFILYRG